MELALAPATVGGAMQAEPCTIDAGASLSAAAATMRHHRVGCLPVLEHGAPVGMLTRNDLLGRALARGADPLAWRVSDVMTVGLCSIAPTASLDDARRQMARTGVRRLVVLDDAHRLVGLVGAAATGRDGVTARPARRVVFFRQILDSCGRPHTVETGAVYVAPGLPEEAVVPLAIRRFELGRGDVPWWRAADGYEVSHD